MLSTKWTACYIVVWKMSEIEVGQRHLMYTVFCYSFAVRRRDAGGACYMYHRACTFLVMVSAFCVLGYLPTPWLHAAIKDGPYCFFLIIRTACMIMDIIGIINIVISNNRRDSPRGGRISHHLLGYVIGEHLMQDTSILSGMGLRIPRNRLRHYGLNMSSGTGVRLVFVPA